MPHRAVLLDRDNTIIRDPGYLDDPDGVILLPGAGEAIRSLSESGFKIVVVTNQSGIARGLLTEETLDQIHDEMKSQLAQKGAKLDGLYFCPYHVDGSVMAYAKDSDLRKPKPGMLLKAAEELDINLAESWMIGDTESDMAAGKAAGCRTVLIRLPSRDTGIQDPRHADFSARNLVDAARIVSREGPRQTASEKKSVKTPSLPLYQQKAIEPPEEEIIQEDEFIEPDQPENDVLEEAAEPDQPESDVVEEAIESYQVEDDAIDDAIEPPEDEPIQEEEFIDPDQPDDEIANKNNLELIGFSAPTEEEDDDPEVTDTPDGEQGEVDTAGPDLPDPDEFYDTDSPESELVAEPEFDETDDYNTPEDNSYETESSEPETTHEPREEVKMIQPDLVKSKQSSQLPHSTSEPVNPPEKFCVGKFLAGICQMIAGMSLLGVFYIAVSDGEPIRGIMWALVAVALQIMALTLYSMRDEK